jgi:magnesium-transporting ATPase (P-type)
MSLLVKEVSTGQHMIMTKGADSIMLPRITLNSKDKEITNQHLYKFACTGLRTLVMGQKKITEEYFYQWKKRYETINTSGDFEKDAKLAGLYDELE